MNVVFANPVVGGGQTFLNPFELDAFDIPTSGGGLGPRGNRRVDPAVIPAENDDDEALMLVIAEFMRVLNG